MLTLPVHWLQRVAEERGEALGAGVGYQIRAEARRSAATRLLFCTTGVLLRRLINDPMLGGVTHVVVDEIHERGMSEDFLLIVLRVGGALACSFASYISRMWHTM